MTLEYELVDANRGNRPRKGGGRDYIEVAAYIIVE